MNKYRVIIAWEQFPENGVFTHVVSAPTPKIAEIYTREVMAELLARDYTVDVVEDCAQDWHLVECLDLATASPDGPRVTCVS